MLKWWGMKPRKCSCRWKMTSWPLACWERELMTWPHWPKTSCWCWNVYMYLVCHVIMYSDSYFACFFLFLSLPFLHPLPPLLPPPPPHSPPPFSLPAHQEKATTMSAGHTRWHEAPGQSDWSPTAQTCGQEHSLSGQRSAGIIRLHITAHFPTLSTVLIITWSYPVTFIIIFKWYKTVFHETILNRIDLFFFVANSDGSFHIDTKLISLSPCCGWRIFIIIPTQGFQQHEGFATVYLTLYQTMLVSNLRHWLCGLHLNLSKGT